MIVDLNITISIATTFSCERKKLTDKKQEPNISLQEINMQISWKQSCRKDMIYQTNSK